MDRLLAVKANQPTLPAKVEATFAAARDRLETRVDLDKGHGRIEKRRMEALCGTDRLDGGRRFPGAPRLPGSACPLRGEIRVESAGRRRNETRRFITSRALSATDAAEAGRGRWAIENRLRRILDVAFGGDLSRPRTARGASNMATVGHFALNPVRAVTDICSIKSRRKIAGRSPDRLKAILSSRPGQPGFGALRADRLV